MKTNKLSQLELKNYPYLHPFLFGFYPVISLIANNLNEIEVRDSFRTLLIVMLIVPILSIVFRLILRDSHRAAFTLSTGILIIFSYGHLYNLLGNTYIFGIRLGRHRILFPTILVVYILLVWVVFRNNRAKENLTLTLNRIGLILVAIPLLQIGYIEARNLLSEVSTAKVFNFQGIGNQQQPSNYLPDIYYILLDGYPRDDILLNDFNFDNTEFLSKLKERDFYIAQCSQANYSYTRPAMASTFNLTYLGDHEGQNHIAFDETQLTAMLRNSYVQDVVENHNYTTITFDTGYKWLGWSEADIVYSPFSNKDKNFKYSKLNGFEALLIKTTALSAILNQLNIEETISMGPRQIQQTRILYDFDTLSRIPNKIPDLKFIYAHITAPHPPFIFGSNGELLQTDPVSEIDGYRDQIEYINTLVINAVDDILQYSSNPPVIIIQSDHGAAIDYKALSIDPALKLGILNAYRLPDVEPDQLYQFISPVNTFRLVFNTYFSGEYILLDDLSILGHSSPFQQLDCYPSALK